MLAQGRGRWSVSQRPKFVNIASELSVALIKFLKKKKLFNKKKLMYAFVYKVIIVTMHVSSVHKSRSGTSVFDSTNKNLLSLNQPFTFPDSRGFGVPDGSNSRTC